MSKSFAHMLNSLQNIKHRTSMLKANNNNNNNNNRETRNLKIRI